MLRFDFARAFLRVLIALHIDLESFPCTSSLLVCEFLENKDHIYSLISIFSTTIQLLGSKQAFNVCFLKRKISYEVHFTRNLHKQLLQVYHT